MKIHSYVTKNRLGIYYFQYSYIQVTYNKTNRKLFRKSLRTRNSSEAIVLARYLWMSMDYIYKKYFKDPELYGRAMKLLSQYELFEHDDAEKVFKFLEELDDLDSHLLDLAIKQRTEDNELQKLKTNQKRLDDLEKKYQFVVEELRKQNSATITQYAEKTNNHLVSELVAKWLEHKKSNTKISTLTTYQDQIALIQKIIEEKLSNNAKISELSIDVIKDVKDVIKNLPSRRKSPIFKDKKFAEIIQLPGDKIASSTYISYLNLLINFLDWCESEGYLENTKKYISHLQFNRKNTKKEKKQNRVPFDNLDLQKIFLSEKYTKGTFTRASQYWTLLIGLFTGARLGEISQLQLNDIRKSDNIYYIDINEDEDGKSVKQKSSIRKVPIHPILIKLDFLGYIEELRKKKQSKLFPNEKRTKSDKFGYLQKCLSNYFKEVGIESSPEKSKTFHSFRHTARTKFVDLGVDDNLIDEIIGHSNEKRSIGRTIYTHTDLLEPKNKAMKKLVYDIDFDKIKKWDFNKFRRTEIDFL